MGQMIVDQVVQLLNGDNVRAEAAYPSGKIVRVTEPVAAVSLEKADMAEHSAVVLVEVLAPKESGGYACQKKALEVCKILEEEGAVCVQGRCSFVGQSDLFRVPVKATFYGIFRPNTAQALVQPVLVAGGMTLERMCDFSARQEVVGTNSIYDAPWEFTVEEFFPWGEFNTLEPDEPFTMDLRYEGNIERFEQCRWTHRERIKERGGIRQIRKGKATGRSLTGE